MEVRTYLAWLVSYVHVFCPDFLKSFMMAMAKKYCFFKSEAFADFKDVIDIIIQLDSFEHKENFIFIVIIERPVDYIRNVHFTVDYTTFKPLTNLFLLKYLKNLDC